VSHIDPTLPLTPSLLDRLLYAEGPRGQSTFLIDDMMVAVQCDLSDLLNTRQCHTGIPVEYAEVLDSIMAYGLPDLTTAPAHTPQEREDLGRVLGTIITRFEPRLRDVRVTLTTDGLEERNRTLRFHVEARLCVDPAPDVAFDTFLELMTGHYLVRPSET
jgi:type VI secretion system protein ImpF